MSELDTVLNHIDRELEASLGRLSEIVRMRSISADPAYGAEVRAAAEWTAATLSALGAEASVRETGGQPMVVGHLKGRSRTHVLLYGHYDVQPADPLDKWTSPPFEVTRKTDAKGVTRLYGRGTADDKGQFLTFVEAARAWRAVTGSLPVGATFLIEGEEESGSPSLNPFLKANRAELTHDVALICDCNMWDAKTPAITTRLRGMLRDEVTITGPRVDLHSGLYGGPVRNPIRVLAKVLADLHDSKGRVTIPGFYDGVPPLPKRTRAAWKALGLTDRKFLKSVGMAIPAGEQGYSALEQVWARPTAEVNGITGGYQGAGTKTVLPAQASAKITFRLVGSQDPKKIQKAFRAFVKARVPADCAVSFAKEAGGNPAMVVNEDSPVIARVGRALQAEFRRAPALIGSGGSIPICGSFKSILGLDSVLVGFGLDDDAIHSPNEKYDLSSFHHGIRAWARIFEELGR